MEIRLPTIQTISGWSSHLAAANVMNDDGTMNELAFEFAGMDRFEARKAVVAVGRNRASSNRKRVHSVGHLERTGVVAGTIACSRNGSSRWNQLAKTAIATKTQMIR